jgi:inosine/xanthosine triphosphatase
MKVRVGSQNPVKMAAVRSAFSVRFPGETIEYEGVEAASGVSEQPMTIEETIRGARNRAMNAANHAAEFAVGIEGGLSLYDIDGREYGLEISWICVLDCRSGESEVASAPGFPVFPKVLEHIHRGLNLSDAMHKEYDIPEIGKGNGVIGWLSDDRITRESSNADAVLLALSSLLKEAGR